MFVLSPLTTEHVKKILQRAHATLCEDNGVNDVVSDELIDYLADLADGDGKPMIGSTHESKERS